MQLSEHQRAEILHEVCRRWDIYWLGGSDSAPWCDLSEKAIGQCLKVIRIREQQTDEEFEKEMKLAADGFPSWRIGGLLLTRYVVKALAGDDVVAICADICHHYSAMIRYASEDGSTWPSEEIFGRHLEISVMRDYFAGSRGGEGFFDDITSQTMKMLQHRGATAWEYRGCREVIDLRRWLVVFFHDYGLDESAADPPANEPPDSIFEIVPPLSTATERQSMATYIGVKIIRARPMQKLRAAGQLGRYLGDGEDADGYLVQYPDGYKSWSPAGTFEQSYRLVSDAERAMIT